MTVRNKKIILIFCLLLLVFGGSYILFLSKVASSKKFLINKEKKDEILFSDLKRQFETKFNSGNKNEGYLFNELFSEDKAISFKDTSLSFFIYSTHDEIKLIDFKYVKCVFLKAESEAIKKRADNQYQNQLSIISKKHNGIAESWANKIGYDMFLIHKSKNECRPYFSNNDSYTLNPISFIEFNRFLVEFNMYQQKINLKNELITGNYKNEINKLKRGLNFDALNFLDRNIEYNSALKTKEEAFIFNWVGYGDFDYSIPRKEIDFEYIENVMTSVYQEQYKNNSLPNGAMPYSYCFGGSNSGNSKVRVNAGASDVVITIKNMNDDVIRHAYVKSGRSFSLNVPNGSYNVYFYYGEGWNPKRFMKDTDCGRLVGGFLSNESVSKDPNTLYINNQEMVYTLSEQVGGNFSTSGSSKIEAF